MRRVKPHLRKVKAKKSKGSLSSPTERELRSITHKDGKRIPHPMTEFLKHREIGSPLLGLHSNFKTLYNKN